MCVALISSYGSEIICSDMILHQSALQL